MGKLIKNFRISAILREKCARKMAIALSKNYNYASEEGRKEMHASLGR